MIATAWINQLFLQQKFIAKNSWHRDESGELRAAESLICPVVSPRSGAEVNWPRDEFIVQIQGWDGLFSATLFLNEDIKQNQAAQNEAVDDKWCHADTIYKLQEEVDTEIGGDEGKQGADDQGIPVDSALALD